MNILNSIQRAYRERPYRNIFVTLMAVILFDAVAPNYFARGRFADLMLAAILLAALFETVRSRHNGLWALVLGLPAIGARVLAAFREDTTIQNTTVLTLTAVFFGFLIWNLLHDLNRSNRPTSERIFGALCAYVFIGLLFALVFTHMEYRRPGTFATSQERIVEPVTVESNLMPIFTYYSFVTLTTLGYGDISPVSGPAAMFAMLEAIIGQLFLVILVARLVGMQVSHSQTKD
jgi:hypothetical protein